MSQASARHILVDSQEKCEELKEQILGGTDFAEVAKAHSTCPSGSQGGELGTSVRVKWSGSSTKWFSAAS